MLFHNTLVRSGAQMDIRAKFFRPSPIPKKGMSTRDTPTASSMGRFSTRLGIRMSRWDYGAMSGCASTLAQDYLVRSNGDYASGDNDGLLFRPEPSWAAHRETFSNSRCRSIGFVA